MSTPTRAFVGRLTELSVFDPLGDQVGRVRDVVVTFSLARTRPRVIGLVVEVPGRRRVFVPMTRVTSVEGGQVITTGLVNMRRFEQRANETLVVAELFERPVQVRTDEGEVLDATVEDVGIEQLGTRGWGVARAFVRTGNNRRTLGRLGRRRGETLLVAIEDVVGLREPTEAQSAVRLLEAYQDLKPADLAEVIHDLSPRRRAEVAAALDDERLADVLEELPEDDQVEILAGLEVDRAADVLEAMEPDDAADLLAELPKERQEELLQMMEPDEAADLRRLLTYDENTAGGLMTTEPVILGPEATVAEALALVRRAELSTALACTVFVCRPRWRRRPGATWAWSTSSGCCASRRTRRSAASSTRTSSRSHPTPPWARWPACSPPTTWSGSRSSTPRVTCSERSPSTTCSTTSSPRTGARSATTS